MEDKDSKDIFIIGGGIHGAAIAADAAGRGLSVTLCEKGDIASATSSASTKLIHGGLRYLELYEFKLVKEALREREILMRKAPHLITPLQFILPYEKQLRPIWLMRLGLFLYDHLSRKKTLPNSFSLSFKKSIYGEPLRNSFVKGFSYYDCFTDDARLTLLNALAAKENNATILTYHEFISAHPENNQWKIKYKNNLTEKIYVCYAKTLINATGSWVNHTQQKINPKKSIPHKLVKGSHIIVPKLYSGEFAYILQNNDKRVVFAIPYQNEFTLIGTTDIPFTENLDDGVEITLGEKNYLCEVINRHFKKSISPEDIIGSYAGVRCLQYDNFKNASEITRDYHIHMDAKDQPPLLTIVGGKITTHRIVAEEVMDSLKPFFPEMKSAWTAFSPLPGGDFPDQDFEAFFVAFKNQFSWLPENICYRYARNYGTRAYMILENAKNINEMGEDFTNGIYEKELDYLVSHEWAKTVDDIVWRRSKWGLVLGEEARNKIAGWLTLVPSLRA